jgi:uncharacterized protein YicC (UPF0701 family)
MRADTRARRWRTRPPAERLESVRATHRRLVDRPRPLRPALTASGCARAWPRAARAPERPKVDDRRLEQELALLTEHTRTSTEELTRLGAHADHFAALLAASDPVGRRMDFVLQEMSREANTLGAKAIDAEITLQPWWS